MNGDSALLIAACRRYTDVLRLLLGAGAHRDDSLWRGALFRATTLDRHAVMEMLLEATPAWGEAKADHGAALVQAARAGNICGVEMLMAAGADPNYGNEFGVTPRMEASCVSPGTVKSQLDMAAEMERADVKSVSPRLTASLSKSTNQVLLLLAARANIHTGDEHSRTALYHAVVGGCHEALKTLIKAGDLIDYTDSDGATPLMLAARAGDTAAIDCLLTAGARFDMSNLDGDSALTLAATRGHGTVVKALVAAGADIHIVNQRGLSAVDLALQATGDDVADVFLPETSLPIDCGECCVQDLPSVAVRCGRLDFVEALLAVGASPDHARARHRSVSSP